MTNQPARYCVQCGKLLNPTAVFCGSCGRPVEKTGDTQPVRKAAAPQPQPTPPPQLAPYQPPTPAQSPQFQAPYQPPTPPPQPAPYQPPTPAQSPQFQAPYQPPTPLQPAPMPAPQAPAEPIFGVIPGAIRQKGLFKGVDNFILVVTPFRIIFATQTNQMVQEDYLRAKEAAKAQGKGFLGQWGAMLTAHLGQKYMAMPVGAILGENPNNFFVANNQVKSVKVHSDYDQESTRTEYTILIDSVSGKIKLTFGNLDEKAARNLLRQSLGGVVK